MRLRALLRDSRRSLSAHGTRGALAIASVGVGVAAVVLTSALGAGAREEVERRLQSVGHLVVVRPATLRARVERPAIRGLATCLRPEDRDALAGLPLVAAAASGAERGGVRVKAGSTVVTTKLLGTTPEWLAVRRFALREGRFLDADDEAQSRRVAVLGSRVADALFGGAPCSGREIRVRGVPYVVVGVLRSKGAVLDGADQDDQVVVPLATALRRALNRDWLDALFVSVRDPEQMAEAVDAVTATLAERHERGDLEVQDTTRSLALQARAAGFLAQLAAGLGALALAVGGVGILALMLLSVRERTSEIGLRLALGATPRAIFGLFLVESTLLATLGWLAGVAVAGLLGLVLGFATDWRLAVPVGALVTSAGMTLVAGVGFGSLPSLRASRLRPIDALRTP